MQYVRTALNYGNFDSEPGEKLREFDADRASAKNNERLWEAFQLQRGIAIQTIKVIQLR